MKRPSHGLLTTHNVPLRAADGGRERQRRGVSLIESCRHGRIAKSEPCRERRDDTTARGQRLCAPAFGRKLRRRRREAQLQVGIGFEGLHAEPLQRAIGCESGQHEAGEDRAAARRGLARISVV